MQKVFCVVGGLFQGRFFVLSGDCEGDRQNFFLSIHEMFVFLHFQKSTLENGKIDTGKDL